VEATPAPVAPVSSTGVPLLIPAVTSSDLVLSTTGNTTPTPSYISIFTCYHVLRACCTLVLHDSPPAQLSSALPSNISIVSRHAQPSSSPLPITVPSSSSHPSLQKCMQIATCSLTRVQCRTRVKQLDTCILTRVIRVSNVHVTNCTI
jgi:hypothetical protein